MQARATDVQDISTRVVTIPVSYTHLDVYKRQYWHCAGAGQTQHPTVLNKI